MKTTILVIEDNPDNMELFAWILEDEGYAFTGVGTAEEGLASLERASFDLVLMDIATSGHERQGGDAADQGRAAVRPPAGHRGDGSRQQARNGGDPRRGRQLRGNQTGRARATDSGHQVRS